MLMLQSLGYTPSIAKRNSAGTVYKANEIIGHRNFDTYIVKISKYAEIQHLKEKVDSYKSRLFTMKERAIVPCNPSQIIRITKEYPTEKT